MEQKKNAIYFSDYEKISDNLIWFSQDVMMRFNVALSSKDFSGNRRSFHQEFQYSSNKYYDSAKGRTIRRNVDCYLSIDVKGDFNNSIMIRYQNMIMLKLKLQQAVQWFTKIFQIKDDQLCIIGKYDNINLQFDKNHVLEFEPVVISYEDGTSIEGIRMYINSKFVSVDIPIERFMAFYYIIDNFDMYQNAIILINYLQRPEYGYNTFQFSGGDNKIDPSFDEFDSKKSPNMGDGSKSFFSNKEVKKEEIKETIPRKKSTKKE